MIYIKCKNCGSKDVFSGGGYDISSKEKCVQIDCGNCGKQFSLVIKDGEVEEVAV